MIDDNVLRRLLDEAEPAVSIYFPITPAQRDVREPEARLRNLIGVAGEALERRGMDRREAEALLAPAFEAASGTDFRQHRDPGLAIFLAPGWSSVTSLPDVQEEIVVVGRRFHVRPMLSSLASNRRFNVLALTAESFHLFGATPYAMWEIPLDPVSPRIEAAIDEARAQQGPAGQTESAEELRVRLMTEDMRNIVEAVRVRLVNDPAPLVLAGEPRAAGHFAQIARPHLPQLLPHILTLNPNAFSRDELHAKAVEEIRPSLDAALDAELDRMNARLGANEPTVSVKLEEVLAGAHAGRIDVLAVASDATCWGVFDMQSGVASVHGTRSGADEDLLNEAVVMALRNGGRAFCLPKERLPRQSLAVALMRY